MKILYGFIELDKEILLSNNLFITILLAILLVFFFILLLSKPLLASIDFLRKKCLSSPRIRKKEDWIAKCKKREGWLQGSAALDLNLEGKYLEQLSFSVLPIGKPKNWRGGVILGNPEFSPNYVVDNLNAITCHVGSHDLEETSPVWIFDETHDRNNPYNTLTKSLKSDEISFLVKVNRDNYLTIEINGQMVYARRINPQFRKKVYLLAWGDEVDCKVKFTNIIYYIAN